MKYSNLQKFVAHFIVDVLIHIECTKLIMDQTTPVEFHFHLDGTLGVVTYTRLNTNLHTFSAAFRGP